MHDYRDHPSIKKFGKKFAELDNYLVSPFYTDIPSMKIRMVNLIVETLREIQQLPPLTFEIYLPLFDRINHSALLACHRYPRLDSWCGFRHTATKQKILEMIRRVALACLKEEAQVNHHEAVSRRKYKKLCERIGKAKSLPLFAMHRHNWPAFFEPQLTASYKELDAIERRLRIDLEEDSVAVELEKKIKENYIRSEMEILSF